LYINSLKNTTGRRTLQQCKLLRRFSSSRVSPVNQRARVRDSALSARDANSRTLTETRPH